jgi:hypothetical protein
MDNKTRIWGADLNKNEGLSGDRRSARRYEIELDMRWKLIRRRRILDAGVGRSIDLSGGGIQIETDRQMPVGLNVELSLTWPVLLRGSVPLQLVVSGRIVRSAGRRAGIRMIKHELKTVSTSAEDRQAPAIGSRTPPALLADFPRTQGLGRIH